MWIIVLAAVCLVGFLYYRPVKAYVETRHVLAQRLAEVKVLAHEKAVLERRLLASASGEALVEEARRLGLVRPGEQLFIVRGIKEWARAHRPSHARP